MAGDDLVVGQDLDPAGGATDLDAPTDPGERHRVAALFEADGGIGGNGARDGNIERFGQDRQRCEIRLLLQPAVGDAGPGGRADAALSEPRDMLLGSLLSQCRP